MAASLKIISPGILSSIQDKGRIGFARFGVPRSGAIDPVSLRLGNALVGNDPYEAAIEFRFIGPTIIVQNGSVHIGIAGNAAAELTDSQSHEIHKILPWQSVILNEGDTLKVLPLTQGATGYLTIEGGIKLDPALGSASTYARARMGGITGLPLQVNDVVPLKHNSAEDCFAKLLTAPPHINKQMLHVIFGPQEDYFSDEQLHKFQNSAFKVSSDVDRMGLRLEGSEVCALPEKGNDITSDGLVVGSIQIPGNGQPIVLCVDCQTVGGYPKIATVISADLHLLGQLKPGMEISFRAVDLTRAQDLYCELEKSIQVGIDSIKRNSAGGDIDLEALYTSNLVDGVVDAQNPGHFPGHLEDMR